MAKDVVGEGIIKLICDLGGLTGGLTEAQGKTESTMGGIAGTINTAMSIASAAAYAAGSAMVVLVTRAVEVGSKFHDLAMQTGMSTEELSRFAYAASTADLEAEDVAQAVGFLSKQMVATGSSADAGSTALGRLGIAVKNTDGSLRSTHSVLIDTANVFQKLPDGPEKTAIAMEVFGKAGKSMIPMLNDGGDAILDLERRADELGITVSTRFAGQADEFGDQMTLMKQRVANTGRSLAEDLLPALNNTMHLLAGDFADEAVPKASQQAGIFSSIMRKLSGDFDDFATKVEKNTGRTTSYMEFMFARWARDIDGAIAGLKYLGDTVTAVLGSIPVAFNALFNAEDKMRQDPRLKAAMDRGGQPEYVKVWKQIEAENKDTGPMKQSWNAVKEWWGAYWKDIERINEEGGKAMEDLHDRYFKAEEDSAKAHEDEMAKIKSEAAARLDRQLQLDIIRMKMELAQLEVQRKTASLDATGLREKDKRPQIEGARDQVRIYADGLAIATREEQIAQGANKDLANAIYVYTKRILEATFANENNTRSIADKRKQEEFELATMRKKFEITQILLEGTMEGYRLDKKRIEDSAAFEADEAKKKIKNAQELATELVLIEERKNAKLATLREKEARDVQEMNRESMTAVLRLTVKGYDLEHELIEEEFRKKEEDARKTIAIKEHLDARLIALEEEKTARMNQLNDEYTRNVVRAIEVVNAEWQAKGPGLVTTVRDIFDQMRGTVSDVFFDILTGQIDDLGDAFKGLFKSILRSITDMLADQVIKMLLDFLMKLIRQIMAARAVASASTASSASGFISMFLANGGVVAGGFRAFANGGVVDQPTLGLVGEGSMNEAIVPLPDGRSIPVKMDNARPLNVSIALAWTQDLIQSFKSSSDEISIVVNRELMSNGSLRKNLQVRG